MAARQIGDWPMQGGGAEREQAAATGDAVDFLNSYITRH